MYCRNCSHELTAGAIACLHCGVPPGKGNEFCLNCANPTHPLAIICVKCGVSLEEQKIHSAAAPIVSAVQSKSSAFSSIVFWAAAVMLIAFFLPWIDVGIISISGWELRDLVRLVRLVENDDYKPTFLLNLMYFLPVFSVLIMLSFFKQSKFFRRGARSWKIIAGIYPLLFFLNLSMTGVKHPLDYVGYGFYLTLIAAVILLYHGIFKSSNKQIVDATIAAPKITTPVTQQPIVQPPVVTPESAAAVQPEANEYSYEDPFPPNKSNRKKMVIGVTIGALLITAAVFVYKKMDAAYVSDEEATGTQAQAATPDAAMNGTATPVTAPAVSSVPVSQAENAPGESQHSAPAEKFFVKSEKAYFFDEANPSTQRKGYLVLGQSFMGSFTDKGYIEATYLNEDGVETKGYLRIQDVALDYETDVLTSGTRVFCKGDYSIVVTINEKAITLTGYRNSGTIRELDKTITGSIVNNKIFAHDGALRFKIVNGVLKVDNYDAGVTDYKECKTEEVIKQTSAKPGADEAASPVTQNTVGRGAGGTGNSSGVFKIRGLAGRKIIQIPSLDGDYSENGKVAVDITVDEFGNVTSVEYQQRGSTTSDPQLKAVAIQKAKEVKFDEGTEQSSGTIQFNFRLSN